MPYVLNIWSLGLIYTHQNIQREHFAGKEHNNRFDLWRLLSFLGLLAMALGILLKLGNSYPYSFFTNPCNRQADQSSSSSLANPLAISSCCTCCFGCIFGMYSLHLFPKVLTIRALCRQDSPWAPIIEFIALTFFPCAVQVSCNHYSVMVLLGCTRHQSI